jgi:hypothetical protein
MMMCDFQTGDLFQRLDLIRMHGGSSWLSAPA